jgi:hypothetical protein
MKFIEVEILTGTAISEYMTINLETINGIKEWNGEYRSEYFMFDSDGNEYTITKASYDKLKKNMITEG